MILQLLFSLTLTGKSFIVWLRRMGNAISDFFFLLPTLLGFPIDKTDCTTTKLAYYFVTFGTNLIRNSPIGLSLGIWSLGTCRIPSAMCLCRTFISPSFLVEIVSTKDPSFP